MLESPPYKKTHQSDVPRTKAPVRRLLPRHARQAPDDDTGFEEHLCASLPGLQGVDVQRVLSVLAGNLQGMIFRCALDEG